MKILLAAVLLVFLLGSNCNASNELNKLYDIPSSSLLLLDENKHEVLSRHVDRALIPASTIKLLTALVALEKWGRGHRFKTEFRYDEKNNVLVVKGFGDPFLISEELDVIANKLKEMGFDQLDGIAIDTSYFSTGVNIDDQLKTNNPYDASASALAVNFNTIEVKVSSSGKIYSAESQTPLTPMARRLAKELPAGRHRVNLGDANHAPKYFVQLLIAKLHESGIVVLNNEVIEDHTIDAELLFTHSNTRTLEMIVSAMLEYSNNFIANQLFLIMGAEQIGAPASLTKSQKMLYEYIADEFDWQDHVVLEGAGLSRKNRLSARQLLDVLKKFEYYKDLMPQQSPHILAKSGTLRGVSCYAGYLYRNNGWQPFAFLINQTVEYRFRERLAEQLLAYDG